MRDLITVFFTFFIVLTANADEKDMKEIKYRGGIVTFSIPKHWIENYEPDGDGIFYEGGPNTGTLRLSVITAKTPKLLGSDAAYAALSSMKSIKPESIEHLPNGNAMTSRVERSSEQGQAITLYWWHVANPIFPNHMRIAIFSYTVQSSQESSASTKNEIQLLTNSIKNATFPPTIDE
jgi:hypothetical protein